ncbi:hypothetical protein GXW82_10670 [Streptacidiphilus sp. 4-A2]|nr:hypothetical protein [Streptacidiphilus sp. 4-A2]
MEEDSVEVAQPVGEVLQRPLYLNRICAAGLVLYTDPSRCPYSIFARLTSRV